jgi:hypothetical protein
MKKQKQQSSGAVSFLLFTGLAAGGFFLMKKYAGKAQVPSSGEAAQASTPGGGILDVFSPSPPSQPSQPAPVTTTAPQIIVGEPTSTPGDLPTTIKRGVITSIKKDIANAIPKILTVKQQQIKQVVAEKKAPSISDVLFPKAKTPVLDTFILPKSDEKPIVVSEPKVEPKKTAMDFFISKIDKPVVKPQVVSTPVLEVFKPTPQTVSQPKPVVIEAQQAPQVSIPAPVIMPKVAPPVLQEFVPPPSQRTLTIPRPAITNTIVPKRKPMTMTLEGFNLR